MLLNPAWWRAAGLRALYTVLAAALPLLAPLVDGGADAARQALLALAFAAVLSIATSLANLPELGGGRTRWTAILDRIVRTFAQTLAAALAAAAAFTDIDWRTLLAQAAVAAGVTLIRTVIDLLPEAVPVASAPTALDVSAPPGYETGEVSAAKDEVADEVRDLLEYHLDDIETVYETNRDPIGEAERIVSRLLELGWRPTDAARTDSTS